MGRAKLLLVATVVAACGGPPQHTTPPRRTGASEPAPSGVLRGLATWYGDEEQGGPTASGERFDKRKLTAAHRTLRMGTRVRVTNTKNGRSVEVRINDRGPYGNSRRIIDVSEAAARRLGMIDAGVVPVLVEILRLTALIELAGLAKHYGPIVALEDITAAIDGKIIGLLGPNGAGKSTLLKCLLGLLPFDGRARVLGLDALTQGGEIRDRVGYMPEQEAFLAGMNAVELCTYAAELSGLPRSEAMQRAHAALYYAGLEEKRYQPIDGYSTGMKQRVKLAQALVHDPEILFLDEPTNGLDPRSREEMLDLIVELPVRRNCAIVLSTHLLPDVERICDHAVIMHHGTVRFVGTIDALRGARGRDSELHVEVKAEAGKLAAALTAVGATCRVTSPVALQVDLPAEATSQLVFRAARDAGLQIRELGTRRESVEAAFLRVLGDAPSTAGGAA